jgi:hypothetical protein
MRKIPVAFQALLSVLLVMPLGAQAPQRGVALPSRPASAGAYYALIIGINAYQHENHLQTAVADAKAIDELLRQRYGFQTKLLLDGDATRDNILGAFGQYRRTLNENDSFLIYYAGHGIRDGDKAYWLPVDADPDSSAHWIISDEVAKSVSVLASRHVLLVSDSCFSGGLSRAGASVNDLPLDHSAAVQKMLERKSRVLISSGGDEPVADGGGAGHSVFANALLSGLSKENDSFSATSLFASVREPVIGNSSQQPQYGMIQNSGHEGGDFVFFPKGVAVAANRPSPSAPRPARITPEPNPAPAAAASPEPNPAPAAKARNAPDPVLGCWQYNAIFSLVFYDDGRVTGFLDGGHWSQTAPNQYQIRWPPSIDTNTVAPGGRTLTGDNNYGGAGANSAQRITNETSGFVGSWRWNNGATEVVHPGGQINVANGPIGGKWTQTGANTFRTVWEFFFLDTLTLTADGRQLTGHNNVNIPVGGVRIPCAK